MRAWWIVAMAGCGGPDEPEEPLPLENGSEQERFADCAAQMEFVWQELGAAAAPPGYTESTLYDELGWLIELARAPFEPVADVALRATWARRPDGSYTSYTLDAEDDGSLDASETVTYEGSVPLVREFDLDGDGTIDERITSVIEDGLPVTQDYDFDADGQPETRYTLHHDELGRMTGADGDDELDGSLDWTGRWTYRADSEDLLSYEENENADAFVDVVEEYEYDSVDRLVRSMQLDRSFGSVSNELLYTYSAGDREPQATEWRVVVEGELVQITRATLAYDADRRLIERVSEFSPGEAPVDLVSTETTSWDCPGD